MSALRGLTLIALFVAALIPSVAMSSTYTSAATATPDSSDSHSGLLNGGHARPLLYEQVRVDAPDPIVTYINEFRIDQDSATENHEACFRVSNGFDTCIEFDFTTVAPQGDGETVCELKVQVTQNYGQVYNNEAECNETSA